MSRIAQRYAKSLLELCIERKEIQGVNRDIKQIIADIKAHKDLQSMLKSPVIKGDVKLNVMSKIWQSQMQPTTMAFLNLVVNKGRESMMREIGESFVDAVRIHERIAVAEVVTAVPMNDETRASIVKEASRMTPFQVELKESVDSALIGGFVLRVGDKQLDASVSSQIKNIKRQLSENYFLSDN
jgi:F-type H+-transporting ATPase subunit delta